MSSTRTRLAERFKQKVGLSKGTDDAEVENALNAVRVQEEKVQALSKALYAAYGVHEEKMKARKAAFASINAIGAVALESRGYYAKVESVHQKIDVDIPKALASKFETIVGVLVHSWQRQHEIVKEATKAYEESRISYDHYRDKVKSLRQSKRSSVVKGKPESKKNIEKLMRNETKLDAAKAEYTAIRSRLLKLTTTIERSEQKRINEILLRLSQFYMHAHEMMAEETKGLASTVEQLGKLTSGSEPTPTPIDMSKFVGDGDDDEGGSKNGGGGGGGNETSGTPTRHVGASRSASIVSAAVDTTSPSKSARKKKSKKKHDVPTTGTEVAPPTEPAAWTPDFGTDAPTVEVATGEPSSGGDGVFAGGESLEGALWSPDFGTSASEDVNVPASGDPFSPGKDTTDAAAFPGASEGFDPFGGASGGDADAGPPGNDGGGADAFGDGMVGFGDSDPAPAFPADDATFDLPPPPLPPATSSSPAPAPAPASGGAVADFDPFSGM